MKNILLLIMIFLVLFIIACNESKRNINTKKHQTFILAKDLKLKMENNEMLHIIDVRSKEEYYGNRGHIPGSKLVPLQTIASSLEKLKNIEKHSLIELSN